MVYKDIPSFPAENQQVQHSGSTQKVNLLLDPRLRAQPTRVSETHMAMGQNPNRTPSEHQLIPPKKGSTMGGEYTYQPKWDPIGFDSGLETRPARGVWEVRAVAPSSAQLRHSPALDPGRKLSGVAFSGYG